jgi:hypothetical protein
MSSVVLAACGWTAAVPAASYAADTTFCGPTMSHAATTAVVSDTAAQCGAGGRSLALYGSDAASETVTTTQPNTRISVTAHGGQCNGAPVIEIAIDGTAVFDSGVGNTLKFVTYDGFMNVPAGVHTVSVRMTNYFVSAGIPLLLAPCARNLYIDAISLTSPQQFAPTSYRNQPLAADAPLDPNSAGCVHELASEASQYGTWVAGPPSTSNSGVPIYTVSAQQPTTKVVVDPLSELALRAAAGDSHDRYWKDQLSSQWANVPLPAGASASVGSDENLVVYQPATDTTWEFWGFSHGVTGSPQAKWGGKLTGVSTNGGAFPTPFGATATGIPFLAGVQRIAELESGAINHVVDFTAPNTPNAALPFISPADRADGPVNWPVTSHALPEGMRFRLPATLNIDSLNLPPYTAMLAKAIQRYGMVLDNHGGVGFTAEEPPDGTNPYTSGPHPIFDGQVPNNNGLMKDFPWTQLQALADTGGREVCL